MSIKLAHPFPAPELRTQILRTLRGFFWSLAPARTQKKKKIYIYIYMRNQFPHICQNSWGNSFSANTCYTCIRTRANAGKIQANFLSLALVALRYSDIHLQGRTSPRFWHPIHRKKIHRNRANVASERPELSKRENREPWENRGRIGGEPGENRGKSERA